MSTTFPRLLATHASQRPHASAMREKEYGIWQSTEWAAMLQMVTHIACGLHQAGLQLLAAVRGIISYKYKFQTSFCKLCGFLSDLRPLTTKQAVKQLASGFHQN